MHLFEVQDPYLAACTYNENYHQNNLYIDMSFSSTVTNQTGDTLFGRSRHKLNTARPISIRLEKHLQCEKLLGLSIQ